MKQRIEKGKTKIVVTLGPSSDNEEIIREFFNLGVDVFRLNFSHGTHDDHQRRIDLIRKIERETHSNVTILMDLQGPKIRLGKFQNGSVTLKAKDHFTLTKQEVIGNEHLATLTYREVIDDVKIGDNIFIDDGLIKLKVIDKISDSVETEVIQGGIVSDHKGVNFPSTKINIPALTDKDVDDLKFGLSASVDAVALSFVKSKEDVLDLLNYMKQFGKMLPIISKIEKWEAVENIEEIVDVSSGVMVARGDLGVELPISKVPIIQKEIIRVANEKGKPVITATQMLGSMVEEQSPTRAEVTDIANAMFDGSDCLMLSNETASGKYPILALSVMRSIVKEVENSKLFELNLRNLAFSTENGTVPEVLSKSIKEIATYLSVKLIVVATETGKTAMLISKQKPIIPVLALTPKEETMKLLNFKWGVFAYKTPNYKSVDEILEDAPRIAQSLGLLEEGDRYIVVCGTYTGVSGTTNLIKVDQV